MSFQHPWTLCFSLAALLFLCIEGFRRSRSTPLAFSNIQVRGILPKVRRKIFFSIGMIFLVFALAQPQWGVREEQVFDQSREVLIAVDLSRSMLATDLTPTRLDRAKIMIEGLLGPLKGERVGLLLFAGTAYLQSPLSPDYEIIRDLIPSLHPDWMPQGGTDYTQMLKVAIEAFQAGEASDRFLIVLSDGESTTTGWEESADQLKKSGVRVISLGLGTEAGTVVPSRDGGYSKDDRGAVVISKLEPKTLMDLASRTNGIYRDATQWVDLHALVQATVDQGKQGKFEEKRHEKKIERFQWFLAIAFFFFLASFIYEMPVRLRPRSMKLSLFFFFCSFYFTLNSSAQSSPENKTNPDPSGLAQEVTQLSMKNIIAATEWASLAEKTIERGRSNPEFPEGIVRDALCGVSKGEKQNAEAAHWKKLREDLENLLKKQNKQDDKKNQKEDKKNDSKESSPQDNSSGKQNPSEQKKPSEQGEQKNDPQSSPKNDPGSDPSKSPSSPNKENSKPQEPRKDGAPGNTPKEPKEGKEGGQNQKVGGANRSFEMQKSNQISKEQFMQLNQVKEGDSPGKLFQVLEGKPKNSETKTKDW